MKRYFLFILVILISACTTHQTTLKQDGRFKIYQLPEEQVFDVVYQEITKVVDNEMVSEVDGPERGFSTRLTFGLDWYNVIVKVVPVEGPDHTGRVVKGYFVELGGRGTYPSNRPRKMIDEIQRRLNETGSGVFVTSYRKTDYVRDRDRWRLSNRPSAREPSNSSDVFDNLRELKKLRDEGVITDQEYQAKKKKLLERLN